MFDRIKSWRLKRALDKNSRAKIGHIEKITGTRVVNPNLYLRALRHRSKLIESNLRHTESYEQLEFLGDAVLDLVVTEILFEQFETRNEGFMTQMRSRIVKGDTLAKISVTLELHKLIEIGNRVKDQGIETSTSVLADIFEALLGALYKDKGYEVVRDFVTRTIQDQLDLGRLETEKDNFKSLLLEYAQARKMSAPRYNVLNVTGPDHERVFEVQVVIDEYELGIGKGKNKKKAEQIAAKESLKQLRDLLNHKVAEQV